MLNLSPEAYLRHLHKIEFGLDYHPCLIGQRIRVAYLRWLHLEVQAKEQIVEAIFVEHYMALLPFKPKK